jgi:hypothetical protein
VVLVGKEPRPSSTSALIIDHVDLAGYDHESASGFVAELTWRRNGLESPAHLARGAAARM